MSTRAVYSFRDQYSTVHVYKHSDGYPTGAARWLNAALPFAWPLPRFEADEFAAAFVAANKIWWLQDQLCDFLTGLKKRRKPTDYRDLTTKVPLKVPSSALGRDSFSQGGGIRLMQSGPIYDVAPADIEYRYEVYQGNGDELRVKAWSTNFWADERAEKTEQLLTDCRFDEFAVWADRREREAA